MSDSSFDEQRRRLCLGTLGAALAGTASAQSNPSRTPDMAGSISTPDLILHNGRFTTLDRANPVADAVAIKDGRFTRVGQAAHAVPAQFEVEVEATADDVQMVVDQAG